MAGGECEECRKKIHNLQRFPNRSPSTGESEAPLIVHEVLRSTGRPLDPATRAFFEPRFGRDFSQVRAHSDTKAAESARAVNALAYTVGSDVVFGAGQYRPTSPSGQQLLAHELTHWMQQRGTSDSKVPQGKLAIREAGDSLEQEADVMAQRIMLGRPAGQAHTSAAPSIQRESPAAETGTKPPEKNETGEVIAEGLKTVAEQAKDNNPQVKKVFIDPIKTRLRGDWNRLGGAEKGVTIGFGVGTLGLVGGGLLADPAGRKLLEGVNLGAPLALIPYMPLRTFQYSLPSGTGPTQRLLKFDTGFDADDLINLRTKSRGLPKMSLKVNLQWGYDSASEQLRVLGGDAVFGLVPGLSLSAGAYKDVLRPPQTLVGPEGQKTEVKKSIPDFDKPQPIPDVRIMLNVDLLKFKPGDFVRQIKGIF